MGWRRRDHYRESFAADPVRIAAIIAGVAADWLSFRHCRAQSQLRRGSRKWVDRSWLFSEEDDELSRAMLSLAMIIHLLASETNKTGSTCTGG